MKKIAKQSGATLIEVAITVLILAVSLLAMATLQTRSLQFNQASYMRSQANIAAYDIADRIRINRGANGANIVNYTAPFDSAPKVGGMVAADVTAWRNNILRSLPGGKGAIECAFDTRICKISIKWDDEQLFGAAASNLEAKNEFVYATAI